MGEMSLKDRVENIKLLLQTDRRFLAGGIFLVLAIVGVSLMSKQTNSRPVPVSQYNSASAPVVNDGYTDLVNALRTQVEDETKKSSLLAKQMDRMNREIQENTKNVGGVLETIVDNLDNTNKTIADLAATISDIQSSNVTGNQGVTSIDGVPVDGLGSGLEPFGSLNEPTPPPPPAAPPKPKRMTVIVPGDSVKVKLLTGVNAPVDGTPYPVVLELDGPITGPDGASLELGKARLIAAAQGSETDGRVLFRLADLAIRHKDGRRSVVRVDGWIVGEDGIRGMQGKLIDKLGKLIAATAGVTFASVLGDRMDSKTSGIDINTSGNVDIDGDDFDVSSVSAFTQASDRLGQILLERYEKLIPVVEVLSGREVVAVFSAPVEVSLVEEDEADEGIYLASHMD